MILRTEKNQSPSRKSDESWFRQWRVAKRNPVEALQYELEEVQDSENRHK